MTQTLIFEGTDWGWGAVAVLIFLGWLAVGPKPPNRPGGKRK